MFAVKLDEDLADRLAEVLRKHNYSVATVRGQSWNGMKDPTLWPKVLAEGRFFITADKGFGDLRLFPPGMHTGILVLRPDKESVLDFQALLETVLRDRRLESLAGFVTVATSRGVRIRRSPLQSSAAGSAIDRDRVQE
jgi:predicted nuclease of predicted toxin-antitoxin system